MDPLSSPSTSVLPFNRIASLDHLQKLFVEKILNEMLGIPKVYDTSNIRKFMENKSILCEINSVVGVELSSSRLFSPESFHKLEDNKLAKEIAFFIKNAQEIDKTLREWNQRLQEEDRTFNTTLPSYQPTTRVLEELGQGYAELSAKRLFYILKATDQLIHKSKKRIEKEINHTISDKSLILLANVGDHKKEDLENNFNNFSERTKRLKCDSENLQVNIGNLFDSNAKFKESFDLLVNKTEGKQRLKAYQWSSMLVPQIHAIETPNSIDIKTITEDQDKIICALFAAIIKKMETMTDQEECALPSDPILTPLLNKVQAWTPFHSHKRIERDRQLLHDIEQFIATIDAVKSNFEQIADRYTAWKTHPPQNLAERQRQDIHYYIDQDEQLTNISQAKDKYLAQINSRMAGDVKPSISEQAQVIMCQTHDISREQLLSQIEKYHKDTSRFEQVLKRLNKAGDQMNRSISDFRYAYSYICYKAECGEGENYFAFYFYLGCFNYANQSQPPKIPTTEEKNKWQNSQDSPVPVPQNPIPVPTHQKPPPQVITD